MYKHTLPPFLFVTSAVVSASAAEESAVNSVMNSLTSMGIPSDLLPYIIAAVAIALLIVIVLSFVRARRRKSFVPSEIKEAFEAQEKAAASMHDDTVSPESDLTMTEVETAPLEPLEEPPVAVTEPELISEPEPVVEATPTAPEPVAEQPKPAAPQKVSRKRREAPKGRGKTVKEDFAEFAGMRILVAEDNMINQKVIRGIFADSGIEITMADNGQIAVDTLEADSDYDLVFMDAHMPVIDGFEATRLIRQNPKFEHIAVVALSGDTAADDIRKMTEAGMEAHLEKPLKMDPLYDVLYCYRRGDEDVSEEGEEAEEEVHLSNTFELLGDDGLDIAGGDEELYREILQEFVEMYGDSDEKLHACIVQDDLDAAGRLLLDIRGVAANIGASPLSDVAEELREAMLAKDEASYDKLMQNYSEHLQALLRDIKKI